MQNSEFESDVIEKMYETYKKKPKIELRLDDSKSENYNNATEYNYENYAISQNILYLNTLDITNGFQKNKNGNKNS